MAVSSNTSSDSELLAIIANAVGGEAGGEEDSIVLLTAASSTGSAVAVSTSHYNWIVYGTWSGATATLEYSPDSGSTWISVGTPATDNEGSLTEVPIGAGHARVAISGAGSPAPSITSSLIRIS